jgi:hypothetical protein
MTIRPNTQGLAVGKQPISSKKSHRKIRIFRPGVLQNSASDVTQIKGNTQ